MAFNFLKTGAASAAMAKQAAAEAEKKKQEYGKLWRWLLNPGETGKLTFVDGDLSDEGFLLPPRWYEHMVYFGGTWQNFVCPEKTNPDAKDSCPNCEAEDRPALVAAFTVIDHRTYEGRNGQKYTNSKKLLIAKPQSFELLNKLAVKRGGLAGCTFEVSRTTKKDAGIGNVFDFEEKRDIETLKKMFMVEITDPTNNQKKMVSLFTPADYEKEIVYRTGAELRALGLGKPPAASLNPGGNAQEAPKVDYSKEL